MPNRPASLALLAPLSLLTCFLVTAAPAQQVASLTLPDAPGYSTSSPAAAPAAAFYGQKQTNALKSEAGVYDTTIQPGQTAPRLTATNEFVASLKSSIAPTAVLGWAISAGYAQLADGSPNYEQGSVGRQYGQRIGAAAARASSETVFGNGIIAPIVHQDPRYYRMGPQHNVLSRAAYAVTRPLITRTNGGHQTLNIWDLGGDLSGSALAQVYYPPINQGFTETMKTFGGSVGGDAIGFAVAEFLPDILHKMHLRAAQ